MNAPRDLNTNNTQMISPKDKNSLLEFTGSNKPVTLQDSSVYFPFFYKQDVYRWKNRTNYFETSSERRK